MINKSLIEACELFRELIDEHGRDNQIAVAIEECAELQKELTKALRDKGNAMRICEEIADVLICLQQLALMYDPENTDISLYINFKIERLEHFFIGGKNK